MQRIAMLSAHSCPLALLGRKDGGGMNVYVRELSRELGKRGFAVDIFTRSQHSTIPPVVNFAKGVRIIHLKAGPQIPYDKNCLWWNLDEFLANLLDFTEEEEINYDIIHSHYWLSGWLAAKLRERWKIPLIHRFHTLGILKNRVARGEQEKEPWIRLQIEQEIIHSADRIVAANSAEESWLVYHYQASPEKIEVIPCGVDLDLFRPINKEWAREFLNLPRKKYFLFVGRIEPIKGIDTLLKAMALLTDDPDLKGDEIGLLIIGGEQNSGNSFSHREMQRLKELAANLGLQKVVLFLGAQPQDQLPYFYSAAEACILLSRYESCGMVALEAMACGRPIIASKVGGLRYTVVEGETGFLVPEGDERIAASRMKLILSNGLRPRLGYQAIQRAKQFGWPLITDQIISLYEETLAEDIGEFPQEGLPEERLGVREGYLK